MITTVRGDLYGEMNERTTPEKQAYASTRRYVVQGIWGTSATECGGVKDPNAGSVRGGRCAVCGRCGEARGVPCVCGGVCGMGGVQRCVRVGSVCGEGERAATVQRQHVMRGSY